MLEIIFVLAGFCAGIIAGLLPGLHSNSIAVLFVSLNLKDFNFILFLSSMTLTQTFFDYIPSTLLSIPSSNTLLSVLPSHKMTLNGKAFEAIQASCYGCLIGVIIGILLIPAQAFFVIQLADLIKLIIPGILIIVLMLMFFEEKNKVHGLIAIVLCSALGLIVLKQNLQADNALFILISGLIGCSAILSSLTTKSFLPRQEIKFEFKQEIPIKQALFGSLGGLMVATLPSLSSSHAGLISRQFFSEMKIKTYLFLLGCINSSAIVFSISMLFFGNKTRTGLAIAISETTGLNVMQFVQLNFVFLFVAGISFAGVLIASLIAIKFIQKINYFYLNLIALALLICLVLISTNLIGLIVFGVSSLIGFFCNKLDINKSLLMCFLIMPTLLIYLGI